MKLKFECLIEKPDIICDLLIQTNEGIYHNTLNKYT